MYSVPRTSAYVHQRKFEEQRVHEQMELDWMVRQYLVNTSSSATRGRISVTEVPLLSLRVAMG
jgi:hypothetical protein